MFSQFKYICNHIPIRYCKDFNCANTYCFSFACEIATQIFGIVYLKLYAMVASANHSTFNSTPFPLGLLLFSILFLFQFLEPFLLTLHVVFQVFHRLILSSGEIVISPLFLQIVNCSSYIRSQLYI